MTISFNVSAHGVDGSADAARVAVNMPRRAELFAEIGRRIDEGRGFALATINLDHVVKLRRLGGFADAYRAQDFVVADGNPIVWLSRLARRPVELIPGSDLVSPLARLAAEKGAPVALIGSRQEVLDSVAARLSAAHPGLEIAFIHAPSGVFDPEGAEADQVIEALGRTEARLAFLALGAPKQEVFAARARSRLPQIGFASVGAGLDFIAGAQRRAPVWMRKLALEWAWRVARDPRRLAMRYAQCALVLPGLVLAALSQESPAEPRETA